MAQFVTTHDEIRDCIRRFQVDAKRISREARRLLRQTSNWVVSADRSMFGPGKFCGYVGLSLEEYFRLCRIELHGNYARREIETVLAPVQFTAQRRLYGKLRDWADGLLGTGTFDGIDSGKWIFIVLPKPKRRRVR